jgi:hypothetical protein
VTGTEPLEADASANLQYPVNPILSYPEVAAALSLWHPQRWMQRDVIAVGSKLPRGLATLHQVHVNTLPASARTGHDCPFRPRLAHNIESALQFLRNVLHAFNMDDLIDPPSAPKVSPNDSNFAEQAHPVRHVVSKNGRTSPRHQNDRSPQKQSGRDGLLFRRTMVLSNK